MATARAHRPGGQSGRPLRVHNSNTCSDICTGESRRPATLAPSAAYVPWVAREIGARTSSHGFTDKAMSGPATAHRPTWDGAGTRHRSSAPSPVSNHDASPHAIGPRSRLRGRDQ
ncbi:hypothetical protein AB0K68_25205 [Streptomyces sp. NPDC050698]